MPYPFSYTFAYDTQHKAAGGNVSRIVERINPVKPIFRTFKPVSHAPMRFKGG